MIVIKIKDRHGEEVLINENKVLYISSSLDGGCIIHFDNDILVSPEPFSLVKEKLIDKGVFNLEGSKEENVVGNIPQLKKIKGEI